MGVFGEIGAAALSIKAQRKEAQAKQVEIAVAKREEASAARDREVVRGRRLSAILGAQAANAAAKGVQMSGSVANISLEDARRAGEESLIDDVNTQGRVDALSRRSRSIKRLSNIRTAATIFRTATSIADRGK